MADVIDRAAIEYDYYLNEQIRQVAKAVAPNPNDDCVDCGSPIGAKRKSVMPSAIRCIVCQNLTESKGGRR